MHIVKQGTVWETKKGVNEEWSVQEWENLTHKWAGSRNLEETLGVTKYCTKLKS